MQAEYILRTFSICGHVRPAGLFPPTQQSRSSTAHVQTHGAIADSDAVPSLIDPYLVQGIIRSTLGAAGITVSESRGEKKKKKKKDP